MAVLLRNYRARYGLDTIRKIITRWAPPSENNTRAYIASVAAATGNAPDQKLGSGWGIYLSMIKAIIKHENGAQPYSDATIIAAIRAAGIRVG